MSTDHLAELNFTIVTDAWIDEPAVPSGEFIPGGIFIFDSPETPAALWGCSDEVLLAAGA